MIEAHLAADLVVEGELLPVYVGTIDHPAGRVLVDTGMIGGDVGYSFDELETGPTEGQRLVLALGALTWLAHERQPKVPR